MRPARPISARSGAAAGVTALVLLLSVSLALVAGPTVAGPVPLVEAQSAGISGGLLAIAARLPRGYAFFAGMIASVNPCGFALLPAYIGVFLGVERGSLATRGASIGRSLVVSATAAFSFAALFGIFGLLVALGSAAVTPILPWVGTAVGIAVILAAGFVAAGGSVRARLPQAAAAAVWRTRAGGGVATYAAFGAAYGLASLGCALPIFLSVVATSLHAGGVGAGVWQFVLFGLGMGAVLAALTIATGSFGAGLIRRLRSVEAYFTALSAVLLWLSGGYVVFYWLTIGSLL